MEGYTILVEGISKMGIWGYTELGPDEMEAAIREAECLKREGYHSIKINGRDFGEK